MQRADCRKSQVYNVFALTHTYTIYIDNRFTALWILSGTTRVSQYQKKHSPTHTYHGHDLSLICFLHLLQSTTSSLFNLRARQSFSTISLQFFFGLPIGQASSIHFFTKSLSSFRSTCPYHRNLFCCSTEIMSSNPTLFLNPLLGTLFATHPSNHSRLCPLKCHLIFLSYGPGPTSMQHTTLQLHQHLRLLST